MSGSKFVPIKINKTPVRVNYNTLCTSDYPTFNSANIFSCTTRALYFNQSAFLLNKPIMFQSIGIIVSK